MVNNFFQSGRLEEGGSGRQKGNRLNKEFANGFEKKTANSRQFAQKFYTNTSHYPLALKSNRMFRCTKNTED